MGAIVTEAQIHAARAITQEQWRELRAQSLAAGVDPAQTLEAVLLPYQQRLIQACAENGVTIVEKSRRVGATWGVGAYAALLAGSSATSGGMDAIYIGYNLDMAREFIDCVAMWARSFDDALVEGGVGEFLFNDGPDKNIAAFRIRFASGFETMALASRPRSLRGRQGFVIIDEAAFHDDLKEVMKAAIALRLWGGRILVISTHNGEENYYNTLVKEARSGGKGYGYLHVDFDEALRDGLYQRVCARTGETWSIEAEADWRAGIIREYGDAADEELFCIPAEGGGAWLSAPLIEARARQGAPVLRLTRPSEFSRWPQHLREADIADWYERELLPILKTLDPQLAHYLGADYGRVSDLTVLWPLAVSRTLRRVTPFVVEMRRIPFDQQRQVQRYVMSRLPRLGASKHDATGLGMSLAEAAQDHVGAERAEAVKLSVEWYRENAQPLRTAFEDDAIDIPADADIVSDLRLIQVKAGVPFVPALKSGQSKDRHGDAAVALMLAYAATRATVLAYDYTTVSDLGASRRGEDVAAAEDDLQIGQRGLW